MRSGVDAPACGGLTVVVIVFRSLAIPVERLTVTLIDVKLGVGKALTTNRPVWFGLVNAAWASSGPYPLKWYYHPCGSTPVSRPRQRSGR